MRDHAPKTFDDLPGWRFDIDEVSAGVYEVIGIDEFGRRAHAKGSDLAEAIAQCREQAWKQVQAARGKS